jgi:hypothetical protein
MQHPAIGHDDAKSAVTFREMRNGTLSAALPRPAARSALRAGVASSAATCGEVVPVLSGWQEEAVIAKESYSLLRMLILKRGSVKFL